ncbi:MAG: pur operon repressor, partial [Cellulosilyticaceae bacterium]
MKKVQKNGRIGIISSILTDNPNQIFTLTHFCDVFDCAKSTISEDIDTIKEL